MTTDASHHLHLRKRAERGDISAQPGKDLSPRDRIKKIVDGLIYAGGILGPLVTLPQLVAIWSEKSAANVSLVSWGGYLIGMFVWMAYGILHKEKPIIFTSASWAAVDLFIVIGILVYG